MKAAELGSGTSSLTLKKISGQALAKNTYYKVVVLAYKKLSSGDKRVLSTSRIIHVATAGGKNGNPAKIKVKSKFTVKARKTVKLKAKQTAKKKTRIKKYKTLSYESSDPKIATVNSKGVVKGLKKGKCMIYVYAQNGLFKKVTVTVK